MSIITLSSYETYTTDDGNTKNRRKQITSKYDWGNEVLLLQGGEKGLVISSDPNKSNYTTAFVEVAIDGTFIRAEGTTLEEAESKAWEKYQARLNCVKHEWVSRGYTNGAGFCSQCGTFQSKVFTGEQLGQFCVKCSAGTLHHYEVVDAKKMWFCESHTPPRAWTDALNEDF